MTGLFCLNGMVAPGTAEAEYQSSLLKEYVFNTFVD